MTEGAWLTTTDPDRMLAQVRGQSYGRKLRLFSCACCRRIEHAILDQRIRTALEVIERCADGRGSQSEVEAALDGMARAELEAQGAARAAARAVGMAWSTPEHARSAAAEASGHPARERPKQAKLLRDILGNPYRAYGVDRSWLSWSDGRIGRLARAIYEEPSFEQMPILADALEEAGCTSQDMLSHCRQRQEHVPGCWILDTLLGTPLVEQLPPDGIPSWSIERPEEREGKFIRQTSCPGGYARVMLGVEPIASSGPVLFLNAVPDGVKTHTWLPAIESGIRQTLEKHANSGRSLRGIRVALTDFKDHPIDSNLRAFEKAASAALAEALFHAQLRPVNDAP